MRTSPKIQTLLADIQLANQFQIPLWIVLANVIEQRSSLAYHSEQTASARIVTDGTTHVLSHSVDSLRQHRDLHIWRTIVTLMRAKLADNFLSSFFGNGHVKRNSHLLATTTSGIPGGLDFYYWRKNVTAFFKYCNGNSSQRWVRMKRILLGRSRSPRLKSYLLAARPAPAARKTNTQSTACPFLILFESPCVPWRKTSCGLA